MATFSRHWLAGLALTMSLAGCPAITPTSCEVGDTTYPGGTINPLNPCQSCQPTLNTLAWSDRAACDAGSSPDAGPGPDAGPDTCTIGGVDYRDGHVNAQSPCQTCKPSISSSSWTISPDGAACGVDPDTVCLNGDCVAACLIDGGIILAGATDAPGCSACLPADNLHSWTELPDGTSCGASGSASICYAGACQPGCLIAGTLVAPADLNAQNPCQSCQPVASTVDWSDLPAGTSCGPGMACDSSGACRPSVGCSIGGFTYPSGTANPADPSQCCNPTTNSSAWIPRLKDVGSLPLGAGPTAIALADFNHDGLTDLAIAAPGLDVGFNDRGISIWLGHSDGTFGPPTSYSACLSWGIAAGDLDGDGQPDVVAGACLPDGGLDIFINRGDGTGSMLPLVEEAFSVPVAGLAFPMEDFDANGTLDLALAGPQAYFLSGVGDGGFAEPVGYPYSGQTQFSWIASGKLVAGGSLDFVIGDETSAALSVYLGKGDGTFVAQAPLATAGGTSGVAVGDFDGDGHMDIASGGSSGSVPLSIFLGNGDGTFAAATDFRAAGGGSVAFADLDRDGRSEALVAGAQPNALSIVWHLLKSSTTVTSLPLNSSPNCIAVGDLNNDGAPDVAVCEGSGAAVEIFLNACP